MKKRLLFVLTSLVFVAAQVFAQQQTVTGKVTSEQGTPLSGVTVTVKGTNTRAATNDNGTFTIQAQPGQTLQFRILGKAPEERVVSSNGVVNLQLRTVATNLDAVVVTALGQSTAQRALGTAQQTVSGQAIAESQRENFVTALQGRVAGVDVVTSSGIPGASSSITIRGISSISSSNQPLMIIDGLPMDNRTLNTGVLVSDQNSTQAFSNRGVDFSNRASDLNPEDIENLVVLKGPEASALYGIDAANGAIVITTKRGKSGRGGIEYSNSFRVESVRGYPEIQRTYGPQVALGSATFLYFGAPYPDSLPLYDNVKGFFQTALTQKHNLAFSGASSDNRLNYRISSSLTNQEGVVPRDKYDRVNLTGASQAQVNRWLNADLSMAYTYADNHQSLKGAGGPLIGLLVWPSFDKASDYLTAAGTRRRLTTLSQDNEIDNPYFSVNKN